MNWAPDAELALQSRVSFGRRYGYLWAIIAGVTAEALVAADSLREMPQSGLGHAIAMTPFDAAVSLLLLVSLPYAAVQLMSEQSAGRLDLRRLTGRRPVSLYAALVIGSSWIFIASAVAVSAIAASIGRPPSLSLAAAMFLTGAALSTLLLAASRGSAVDTWVSVVALFLVSGVTLVAIADRPRARIGLGAVAAVIAIGAFPFAVARLRRPRVAGSPISIRTYGVKRLERTRLPAFWRSFLGVRGSLVPIAFLVVATPFLMATMLTRAPVVVRDGFATAVLYMPALIGAFQCFVMTRADRDAGAAQLARLTNQSSLSFVMQLVLGCASPYVVVAAAAIVPLILLRSGATPFLTPWPLVTFACLTMAAAEGFAGRRFGVYVGPSLLFAVKFIETAQGRAWTLAALVLWLPAAIAAGRADRADGPAFSGRTAWMAAACLGAGAAALCGGLPFGFLATSLALMSGFFVEDNARMPLWNAVLLAVLVGLFAAICEFVWIRAPFVTVYRAIRLPAGQIVAVPARESQSLFAMLQGVASVGGFLFGCLVHNRSVGNRAKSLILRSLPFGLTAVAAMALLDTAWSHVLTQGFARWITIGPEQAFDVLTLALLLAVDGALITVPERRHADRRSRAQAFHAP